MFRLYGYYDLYHKSGSVKDLVRLVQDESGAWFIKNPEGKVIYHRNFLGFWFTGNGANDLADLG